MSRWKDTLCGSHIKSFEPNLEDQILKLREQSKVLSSGGQYIAQGQRFLTRSRILPTVIHLPKGNYEILVGSLLDNQYQRYGGEMDPFLDLDLNDSELELLDHKV